MALNDTNSQPGRDAIDRPPPMNSNDKSLGDASPHDQWLRATQRAKNLWVTAVAAFYISIGILVTVYLVKNRIDVILISVVLGMMMLGVWLKARYQLMLRKQPPKPADDKPDL